MKVLYDYQIFNAQRYGGLSRYFSELLSHFVDDSDIDVDIGLKYSNNKHLSDKLMDPYSIVRFDPDTVFPHLKFKGRGRILYLLGLLGLFVSPEYYHRINQKLSMSKIKHKNYDIINPT